MDKIHERFFIPMPTPTDETEMTDNSTKCRIYLNAKGKQVKWSGDFQIPEIGDRILVKMNSIGPAYVKGYFESCGFVGVMAQATDPPKWYVRQSKSAKLTWQRQHIGCFFGLEIEPTERRTS
jgi:hypothetical protein